MGLWILDDNKLQQVPGTALLTEGETSLGLHQERYVSQEANSERLKHDISGPIPIVLIPQPSDNPNDPLNWSIWKRDGITLVLCLISIMAATLGPLLAANTVTLAWDLSMPPTEVALLTGYHLCGVGVAGFFFVPTARVWGKRHLYILGNILLIASSIWGGQAKSYRSLLGARILQGVAVAPFEALVNASIGDLYYIHQRGARMAFTNFALYGGAFFTPVIVGKMTHEMGWRWCFHFVAIFSAMLLPFVVMFVPETAFRRNFNTGRDPAEDNILSSNNQPLNQHNVAHIKIGPSNTRPSISSRKPVHKIASINEEKHEKVTWLQSMAFFNGRKTEDNLWKLALRPLPLLIQPAIFWGMITQGTLIGWTVMIGVVLGFIFAFPPYFMDEVQTGYLYSGAFLGAVCGFAMSGWLADWSAKFLARKNGGVYEPEFRIFLVIPQSIFGVIGVFGFGVTANNAYKFGYILPSFFFGLEVMGMVLGATASALYLVDAHRDVAIESFTALLLFKNFFSFGLTWVAYDWMVNDGVWKMFWIVGIVQIIVGLISVPMYILGKRNRSLNHRHNLLKFCGLN